MLTVYLLCGFLIAWLSLRDDEIMSRGGWLTTFVFVALIWPAVLATILVRNLIEAVKYR